MNVNKWQRLVVDSDLKPAIKLTLLTLSVNIDLVTNGYKLIADKFPQQVGAELTRILVHLQSAEELKFIKVQRASGFKGWDNCIIYPRSPYIEERNQANEDNGISDHISQAVKDLVSEMKAYNL